LKSERRRRAEQRLQVGTTGVNQKLMTNLSDEPISHASLVKEMVRLRMRLGIEDSECRHLRYQCAAVSNERRSALASL
jgi:hypothetical protein